MNIGIVTTWTERGAAYVSRAYMDALQSQGENVYILARGGEEFARGDPKWDLPNVTWTTRYGSHVPYSAQYVNMNEFTDWLGTRQIQVVIFNEEHTTTLASRTSLLGVMTGAYIDYYTRASVNSFAVYDFLLCNTRRHYSVFKGFGNALFVPWGTDPELFTPRSDYLSMAPSDPVVFFHSAGMNMNRKGTDLLLQAFSMVRGNARLIIHAQVGPQSSASNRIAGLDSASLACVRRLTSSDPRVTLLVKTVTAPGLYHLGDVYVYPSRLDGIGLSVPEALACGLPVITTDCPPMSEFVEPDVNGSLVPVARSFDRHDGYYWPMTEVDPKSLGTAMQQYVDDRERLIRQKASARAIAQERFTWSRNSSALANELRRLFSKCPRNVRKPRLGERLVWHGEAAKMALARSVHYSAHSLRNHVFRG